MEKDFDGWTEQKKAINGESERLYFHTGDVWWVKLGVNVGFEMDGKRDDFARPVIVLKKFNQFSFLALPLTTNARPSPYRFPVGEIDGKLSFAVLS
jgi:mRNA interferase MazF